MMHISTSIPPTVENRSADGTTAYELLLHRCRTTIHATLICRYHRLEMMEKDVPIGGIQEGRGKRAVAAYSGPRVVIKHLRSRTDLVVAEKYCKFIDKYIASTSLTFLV